MPSLSSSISPCPSGGQFYACPSFIGCCITQTCNNLDRCSDDNLRPASLNASYSNKGHCRAGSSWKVCENTLFSFMGCCKGDIDPCLYGCPQEDLTPARLSFNEDIATDLSSTAAPLIPYTGLPFALLPTFTETPDIPEGMVPVTSTAQGSATSSSIPNTIPAVNQAANTATNTAGQSPLQTAKSAPRSNTAAIAGGVVGGIVVLGCLLALLAIYGRRRIARPMQDIDDRRYPALGTGSVRALQPDNAELEEMKQGPSPSKCIISIEACIALTVSLQHLCVHLHLFFIILRQQISTHPTDRTAMS